MKADYLILFGAFISLIFVFLSVIEKGYISDINLYVAIADGMIFGFYFGKIYVERNMKRK